MLKKPFFTQGTLNCDLKYTTDLKTKAGKFIGIDAKFLDFAEMNGYAAILIGFFGAALFQSIYDYIENPAGGFSLSSGLTFLGGLIGGVSSFIIIYLFY